MQHVTTGNGLCIDKTTSSLGYSYSDVNAEQRQAIEAIASEHETTTGHLCRLRFKYILVFLLRRSHTHTHTHTHTHVFTKKACTGNDLLRPLHS